MPYDDRLFKLLGQLDARELQGIWEVALKCKPGHEDFALGTREWQVACISEEWRAVHGHTMWNIRRGKHEMPWKRILIDVADKLKRLPQPALNCCCVCTNLLRRLACPQELPTGCRPWRSQPASWQNPD